MSRIAGRLKSEEQVDQVASLRLLIGLTRAAFAVVHPLFEMCVDVGRTHFDASLYDETCDQN